MSVFKSNKQFLLLLVVFSSIFLSQGVAANKLNCKRCKRLHKKSIDKQNCKKQCINKQKKTEALRLEPQCNGKCCKKLCKIKDADQACTAQDYCGVETDAPTNKPTPSPTPSPSASTPTPGPTSFSPTSPTPTMFRDVRFDDDFSPSRMSPTQSSCDDPFGELVNCGFSPPSFLLPLNRCEGDCDDDNECEGDLVCYQRNNGQAIPGCDSGTGDAPSSDFKSLDFCVDPSDVPDPSSSPTSSPTSSVSPTTSHSPSTSPTSTFSPTSRDAFCDDPFGELVLCGLCDDIPSFILPLKRCEGDCTTDNDCEGDLLCFQRSSGEAVPGCDSGIGLAPDSSQYDFRPAQFKFFDFCVDPTDFDR